MPIYDHDGTASREIGKLWDNDGTSSHQIGRAWDNDGTASYPLYSSSVVISNNPDHADYVDRAWSDVGYDKFELYPGYFTAVAGHRYVVAGTLGGFASLYENQHQSDCTSVFELYVDGHLLVGHYVCTKFEESGNTIYTAPSSGIKYMTAFCERRNTWQGDINAQLTMVVDITELENERGARFSSANEFFNAYGFFTGSKEVEV